jgi:hypothetical protein
MICESVYAFSEKHCPTKVFHFTRTTMNPYFRLKKTFTKGKKMLNEMFQSFARNPYILRPSL